jgi:hypothetical protein
LDPRPHAASKSTLHGTAILGDRLSDRGDYLVSEHPQLRPERRGKRRIKTFPLTVGSRGKFLIDLHKNAGVYIVCHDEN